MVRQIWTVEDKAAQKIADVASDLRLNMDTVGEILGASQPADILNRLASMTDSMYHSRVRLRERLGYKDIEGVTKYPTDLMQRCALLVEFNKLYGSDESYEYLFTQADIGFPAALIISLGVCEPTDSAVEYINEAWDLLLARFGLQDTGFKTLSQITGEA